MKSLKIVNELVSLTKNEIKVCLSEKSTSYLLVIKQDLEVLEIIKNKKPNITSMYLYKDYESYLARITTYGYLQPDKYLTKEEFYKVKQWLEVNE